MVKLHLNNQHQNSRKVRVFNKVQLQVVWFSGRSCREAAAALLVRTLSPPAFFLQPSQTNSLTFQVGFPTVPQQKDEELPLPTVLTKWHEQSSLWRHMSHAILSQSTMSSSFVTLWLRVGLLVCFKPFLSLFSWSKACLHFVTLLLVTDLARHNVMSFFGVKDWNLIQAPDELAENSLHVECRIFSQCAYPG